MKKIKAFIILLVIFSLLPLTSVFGWNSHGLTLSYEMITTGHLDFLQERSTIWKISLNRTMEYLGQRSLF